MTLLLSALAMCLFGVFLSVIAPGAIGRIAGFLSLGLAGASAGAGATEALKGAVPIIFGSSEFHMVLRLDPLAAFFILIIAAVSVAVAAFGLGPRTRDERRSGRTASGTACAIAFASLLACSANDVLLFIFAWELLALTFFWAIAYAGTDKDSPRSAYVTIVVTHVAGAGIIAALLVLAHVGRSFGVDAAIAGGRILGPGEGGLILLLLLFGFGAKFGILPMQVWLPLGYRSAPSLVSALMAGGALNVGFYGVTRFVVPFPHTPLWFAAIAIAVGAITAFFGIAWASGQRDMRRLAAYSSVENGGIILAALGVAIAARTLRLDVLVGFAIAAAFMQIAAHAVAKSTLFLVLSTVRDRTSTTSFERLGGLAHSMPVVTIIVLLCAMSLSALPPLAGFVGEWLVLESLMQAFRTGNVLFEVIFALAGAVIGVAAGIAIVAFTKLVGIGFLGAPRTQDASDAMQTRSPWQLIALLIGGSGILAGGLLAAPFLSLIAPAVDLIAGAPSVGAMIGAFPLIQPTFAGFSSTSPLGLGCVIAGFTFLFWILARFLGRAGSRRTAVWTSGESYRSWTQYTGTGYANPTRVILDAGVRTLREVAVEDPVTQHKNYRSELRPFFELPFYKGIASTLVRVSGLVRATQSGVIAAYLSYILVFTILLLILYPSIRHW